MQDVLVLQIVLLLSLQFEFYIVCKTRELRHAHTLYNDAFYTLHYQTVLSVLYTVGSYDKFTFLYLTLLRTNYFSTSEHCSNFCDFSNSYNCNGIKLSAL